MTWRELLDLARDQLSDHQKVAWSDDQLIRYMGLAQEKACRWGYLLRATKTVTIDATNQEYDFPDDVLFILRIIWGGATGALDVKTSDYMDRARPGWDQGEQTGDPKIWVQDQDVKKFKLWRKPDADAITESPTLTLTCVMLPAASPTSAQVQAGTATPEIEEEHHEDLVDYILYLAHKQDSQADGREKATADLALFKHNMNQAKHEVIQQTWGNTAHYPRHW